MAFSEIQFKWHTKVRDRDEIKVGSGATYDDLVAQNAGYGG
jgi:hypothetical protein